MSIKIASFNTNSIRARLHIIIKWLKETKTDILCLQETKVQDKDFPEEAFKEIGYSCAFKGQKSYNGVAIISNLPIENKWTGFDGNGEDEGSRIISAKIEGLSIINTYIPQGFAPDTEKFLYKLNWLERLLEYFKNNFKPDDPLIWLGDFNIAPEKIDLYDPDNLYGSVGFHPEEHKKLSKFKEWGFIDIFRLHKKEVREYTFYDYRIINSVKRNMGWRIDHIWATKSLSIKSINSFIDINPRLAEKPSDHTFIVAEFKL